jgi:hypothetical protein
MKNAIESAKKLRSSENGFSKFSVNEILSPEAMFKIRGGDGGEGVIIDPPKRPGQ